MWVANIDHNKLTQYKVSELYSIIQQSGWMMLFASEVILQALRNDISVANQDGFHSTESYLQALATPSGNTLSERTTSSVQEDAEVWTLRFGKTRACTFSTSSYSPVCFKVQTLPVGLNVNGVNCRFPKAGNLHDVLHDHSHILRPSAQYHSRRIHHSTLIHHAIARSRALP